MAFDVVGGCPLDNQNKEILLSHGENFAISQWAWNGLEYVKKGYFKFSIDRDKVASNLRHNRFCKNNTEVFCVSAENNLIKI